MAVEKGAEVEEGALICVIEAMKMENELCADAIGVVRAILAKPGETVDGGARLVEMAAEPRLGLPHTLAARGRRPGPRRAGRRPSGRPPHRGGHPLRRGAPRGARRRLGVGRP